MSVIENGYYFEPIKKYPVKTTFVPPQVNAEIEDLFSFQEINSGKLVHSTTYLPSLELEDIEPGMFTFNGLDIISQQPVRSATYTNCFARLGNVPDIKTDKIEEFQTSPTAVDTVGMIYCPMLADHSIDLYRYYHYHNLKGNLIIYMGFFHKCSYLVIPASYFLSIHVEPVKLYFLFQGTLLVSLREVNLKARSGGIDIDALRNMESFRMKENPAAVCMEDENGTFFFVEFATFSFQIFVPLMSSPDCYVVTALSYVFLPSIGSAIVEGIIPTSDVHFMDVLNAYCYDGSCRVAEQYSTFCSMNELPINHPCFYSFQEFKRSFSHPIFQHVENDSLHHASLDCSVCGVSHQQGYLQKYTKSYIRDRKHFSQALGNRMNAKEILRSPWSKVSSASYGRQIVTGVTRTSMIKTLASRMLRTGICACYFDLPCGNNCSAGTVDTTRLVVAEDQSNYGVKYISVQENQFIVPETFSHDMTTVELKQIESREDVVSLFSEVFNYQGILDEVIQSLPSYALANKSEFVGAVSLSLYGTDEHVRFGFG